MPTEEGSPNPSNRMSSDVDEEIYDDCVSLPKPKPPIMQKPVKNIAAMFGGAAKNSTGPNKPVAGVTRQISATPKQLNNPTVNVSKPVDYKPLSNGRSEPNNNNNRSLENPVKSGGKISIPSAFNKPGENSELTGFINGLRPVGGINSKKGSETKTSPTDSSKKTMSSVPPKSPNTLQNEKTNTVISPNKALTTSSNGEKKVPSVSPKSPVAKTAGVTTFSKPPAQSVSPASKTVLLSCDKVKYCLKNKPKFWGKRLNKPAKMDNVDLGPVNASRPPDLPRRPPPGAPPGTPPGATKSEQRAKIRSIIEEYHEEDELRDLSGGQLEQETYDDASVATSAPDLPARTFTQRFSPGSKSPNSSSNLTSLSSGSASISISTGSETYDDCMAEDSEMKGTYDEDEVYEDVGDVQKNAAMIAKKEEEKKKELERKEKKERDKQEKDEKEKQKKLEEKQKKLEKERKKFKITGDEVALSEGRVIKDSRGGKLDLPLKSGEMVSIIRMTDNPALKWLAKLTSGKVGYVEISNIEIMQGSLDNVKNASLRNTNAASGVFEEVYDDVDIAQDGDQDIYEETG